MRCHLRSHPQNPMQQPYDYLKVHPFEIKYTDGQQKPYKPMRIPVATRFFEKFSIPNGMDPTVQVILELFLLDSFLARVMKNELLSWSTGSSDLPMNTPTLLPLQISDRGSTPVSLVCPLKGWNPHGCPCPYFFKDQKHL